MPEIITEPSRIPVPGGKIIDEFAGRVATGTPGVSVARMQAPPGWSEPAQTPDFDEITLVLRGSVIAHHDGGVVEVRPGQALLTRAGERVRYEAGPEGAEYVAVCVPAFAPELAHREEGPGPDPGAGPDSRG
ncbi:MAG TPA: AraC family ligand binding domain-containing protein [Kineosporiaceae bacterium]|nr:AraC family ligand binding domain-containing protein [Kineosporiaceae bacterium]